MLFLFSHGERKVFAVIPLPITKVCFKKFFMRFLNFVSSHSCFFGSLILISSCLPPIGRTLCTYALPVSVVPLILSFGRFRFCDTCYTVILFVF
jgi:hypothetical protein